MECPPCWVPSTSNGSGFHKWPHTSWWPALPNRLQQLLFGSNHTEKGIRNRLPGACPPPMYQSKESSRLFTHFESDTSWKSLPDCRDAMPFSLVTIGCFHIPIISCYIVLLHHNLIPLAVESLSGPLTFRVICLIELGSFDAIILSLDHLPPLGCTQSPIPLSGISSYLSSQRKLYWSFSRCFVIVIVPLNVDMN